MARQGAPSICFDRLIGKRSHVSVASATAPGLLVTTPALPPADRSYPVCVGSRSRSRARCSCAPGACASVMLRLRALQLGLKRRAGFSPRGWLRPAPVLLKVSHPRRWAPPTRTPSSRSTPQQHLSFLPGKHLRGPLARHLRASGDHFGGHGCAAGVSRVRLRGLGV